MEDILEKYIQGNKDLVPIVLIHGDLQNHTSFQRISEMMNNKGHTIFSFDLPGHGSSEFSEKTKNLPRLLQNLLDKNKLEKSIIMGNSSGGILAVDYAIKTRKISGLVLINSCLSNPKYANPKINWDEIHDLYENLSKEKFQKQELVDYSTSENPTEEEVRELCLRATSFKGLENNFNFYTSLSENNEIYGLDIPILFITSEKDPIVPLEYVRNCVTNLKRSRLIEVKEGHNVLVTNPEKIIKILRENYSFLVGQEAS